MIPNFLSLIRKVLGIEEILLMLKSSKCETIGNSDDTLLAHNQIELLPGSVYSQYAIPLDYLPSRSYAPRWGYQREKIEVLDKWFESFEMDFRNFVSKMFAQDYSSILVDYDPEEPSTPAFVGGAICAFDALAIYTFVSDVKPKIYCEIGSGMTTLFAKQSIIDNKLNTLIISIDPEPRQYVDDVCDEVIRMPLENMDPDWFQQLDKGDILFVDGSHRSFMNSDVTVFFIDVLPKIKPGVVIHIHDITLPYDYPDSYKEWYWNEQYLLAVYLMASMDKISPLLPTTYVCRDNYLRAFIQENLTSLGNLERDESWLGGGSFWFTKKETA